MINRTEIDSEDSHRRFHQSWRRRIGVGPIS